MTGGIVARSRGNIAHPVVVDEALKLGALTGAEREYAYDHKSAMGRLAKALNAAAANRWTAVEMRDWLNCTFLDARDRNASEPLNCMLKSRTSHVKQLIGQSWSTTSAAACGLDVWEGGAVPSSGDIANTQSTGGGEKRPAGKRVTCALLGSALRHFQQPDAFFEIAPVGILMPGDPPEVAVLLLAEFA